MELRVDTRREDLEQDGHSDQPQLFVRQVDDPSLPAEEVLSEQTASGAPEDLPRTFVP